MSMTLNPAQHADLLDTVSRDGWTDFPTEAEILSAAFRAAQTRAIKPTVTTDLWSGDVAEIHAFLTEHPAF